MFHPLSHEQERSVSLCSRDEPLWICHRREGGVARALPCSRFSLDIDEEKSDPGGEHPVGGTQVETVTFAGRSLDIFGSIDSLA